MYRTCEAFKLSVYKEMIAPKRKQLERTFKNERHFKSLGLQSISMYLYLIIRVYAYKEYDSLHVIL